MRDVAEHSSNARLRISEQTARVQILRIWQPGEEVLARLAPVLGAPLPTKPNTVSGGDCRLLWMGPGEWAIIGGADGLEAGVTAACGDALHHLADVSDGRALLVIEGEAAPDLLAKGCSLDFHPRAFPGGTCAQSLFAQLRVLIERPTDAPSFRVVVDRSSLAHLRAWFDIASAEFLEPTA